jgi:predicted Zn-dependent peptidase
MSFEMQTLDSGLTVAAEHIPTAHTTAVTVMVKVGGLYESDSEVGLSHLVEHCVHKQTQLFKDQQERLDYEHSHQYESGASTSQTRTLYYGRGPQFDSLLKGLASLIATPTFNADHVAEEVLVVTREAKMHKDAPSTKSYFASTQHMYNSPYSRPVIGFVDQLNFSPDEVRNYHGTKYSLGKIAVVASGKSSMSDVVGASRKYLEESPLAETANSTARNLDNNLPELTIGDTGIFGILGNQSNNISIQTRVPMSEHLKNKFTSEDRFAYWLASGVISKSISKSLREYRQLSYDGGYFLITEPPKAIWETGASVTCDPSKLDEALEAIQEGIVNAGSRTHTQLQNEKLWAEGSVLSSLDEVGSHVGRIIASLNHGMRPLSAQELVKSYKKIKPSDIREAITDLVNEYETTDKFVFVEGAEEAIQDYPILEPNI